MANLQNADAWIESVAKTFVYIQNLPPDMDEWQLSSLFWRFEPMTKVKIVRHIVSGLSKCHGFVKFKNIQNANLAVNCFNGFMVSGNRLKLSFLSNKDIKNDNNNCEYFSEEQLLTYLADYKEIAKMYLFGFVLPHGVAMGYFSLKLIKHIVEEHLVNFHPEIAQKHMIMIAERLETKPIVPGGGKESAMDSAGGSIGSNNERLANIDVKDEIKEPFE